MTAQRPKPSIPVKRILCLFLALWMPLFLSGTGMAAGAGRRYSGSAYYSSGYSAYAVVSETSPDAYEVRIALQFAPGYTANDVINGYQLILNDTQAIGVFADAQQPYDAPTSFFTTVQITGPIFKMAAVPVYENGGADYSSELPLVRGTNDLDAFVGTTAVVKNQKDSSRLNLRSAPLENADVWMQYYNGVPVLITGVLPDGWVSVSIGDAKGGERGYMKAQYLAFGADAQRVQPTMPAYGSTASSFSLRGAPDESSPILSTYSKGTGVTVLGLSKHWWHAQVNETIGYVKIGAIEGASAAGKPASINQPVSLGQPSAPSQPANAAAKLQAYSAKRLTDNGWTVDAVVTEVSPGQFVVNVTLDYSNNMMNDIITGYNLYVNGVYAVTAEGLAQDLSAPTRFKGSFSQTGFIASLRLIPILEKSGEHTSDDEFVDFRIQ